MRISSRLTPTSCATRRGVVGRAELAREQAGKGLHLVASGEEGELLGVGGTKMRQPLLENVEGLVPRDRLELASTTLAAGLAPQRLQQPGRRILLHDPRRALGTQHALVERMVGVALDVAQFTIAQVDADAAAAGAHVAGGGLDLGLGVGQGLGRRVVQGGAGQRIQDNVSCG